MKVLVVGASGTVGSEVVRLLKGQGIDVRETTSQTSKVRGQGKVLVDLATGEGIKAAFEGIDKAFLLSPPGYADHYAILSPLIQEAKRRGLKKVVLMTAMGANAVETSPARRAEIELEKSGLAYNIIRPNWFMQNFSILWAEGIRGGRLELPAGTAKTSFIDARDISEVAFKLLTTDKFDNRDFDLTGPAALTHAEAANLIGGRIGKPVAYSDLEPSQMLQRLVGGGVPKDYAEFLVMIFGFLAQGYNERQTENVQLITGHQARSFNDYLKSASF